MGETTAAYAALLKTWYTDQRVIDSTYKNNALHALLAKDNEFGGSSLPIPIVYGNPQGRSAAFSTALANKGSSKSKAFSLTRKSDYSLASIGREVMKASKMDKGAFLQAAKVNIDGALNQCTRSIATAEYGNASGVIGQISSGSTVSTATITLADINQVTNFEVGMVLAASAAGDGTGSVRSGTVTLTGIDRNAGTLTASGNWTAGISAAATGDYLSVAGDYGVKLSGLLSWLPWTAPTAGDSFNGVDRSPDPVRLAGVRHDGSGQSVEEALIDAQSKAAREGAVLSHIFLNNVQYRQMLKSLSSKVKFEPTVAKATAAISFNGVELLGDAGPITILPDFNCPSTYAFGLQLDTWKLYSLDDAPHIFDRDNDQEMLREASADSYEVRIGYYAELGCSAPGKNVICKLAAAT